LGILKLCNGQGLVLFGTRPEAIKIITFVEAYRRKLGAESIHLCCSGQHKSLIDDTIEALNFSVDVNFELMSSGQTPADIASRVQARTIKEIEAIKPQWILVHGDTATTLGGALAGFYTRVPVIHLEAGLRTYNKHSPWPEEGIRQAVTRLADYHLAPTPRAQQNLLDEKVSSDKIRVVGNPGADHLFRDHTQIRSTLDDERKGRVIVLVTLHRRENQGKYLSEVLRGVEALSVKLPEAEIRFVLHPNPQIRSQVDSVFESFSKENTDKIKLLQPLPYYDFQAQLKSASLIITDSGGLQEEAALLGIPTIIARETTERPEIVELGLAWMGKLDAEGIASKAFEVLGLSLNKQDVATWRELQGGGEAGEKTAAAVLEFFENH